MLLIQLCLLIDLLIEYTNRTNMSDASYAYLCNLEVTNMIQTKARYFKVIKGAEDVLRQDG